MQQQTLNGRELVRDAATGCSRAGKELDQQLRPFLHASALRLLGSVADADEVVQDTLLELIRNGNQFEGRCSVKTFAYRIQFRKIQRRWKRQQRGRELIPVWAATARCLTDEAQRLRGIELQRARLLREKLGAAFGTLPSGWRDIFILHVLEEKSFAKVSAIVGVPTSTVQDRFKMARSLLERSLRDQGVDKEDCRGLLPPLGIPFRRFGAYAMGLVLLGSIPSVILALCSQPDDPPETQEAAQIPHTSAESSTLVLRSRPPRNSSGAGSEGIDLRVVTAEDTRDEQRYSEDWNVLRGQLASAWPGPHRTGMSRLGMRLQLELPDARRLVLRSRHSVCVGWRSGGTFYAYCDPATGGELDRRILVGQLLGAGRGLVAHMFQLVDPDRDGEPLIIPISAVALVPLQPPSVARQPTDMAECYALPARMSHWPFWFDGLDAASIISEFCRMTQGGPHAVCRKLLGTVSLEDGVVRVHRPSGHEVAFLEPAVFSVIQLGHQQSVVRVETNCSVAGCRVTSPPTGGGWHWAWPNGVTLDPESHPERRYMFFPSAPPENAGHFLVEDVGKFACVGGL